MLLPFHWFKKNISMERRKFIQVSALSSVGILVGSRGISNIQSTGFISNRLAKEKRKFINEAVSTEIE